MPAQSCVFNKLYHIHLIPFVANLVKRFPKNEGKTTTCGIMFEHGSIKGHPSTNRMISGTVY
jgi:hypothetical protein